MLLNLNSSKAGIFPLKCLFVCNELYTLSRYLHQICNVSCSYCLRKNNDCNINVKIKCCEKLASKDIYSFKLLTRTGSCVLSYADVEFHWCNHQNKFQPSRLLNFRYESLIDTHKVSNYRYTCKFKAPHLKYMKTSFRWSET